MKQFNSVDVMKAFGILLVILGHITRNCYLGNYIYSFHMPLFFFISGFLYSERNDFCLHKAHRILIPYYSFSLLSFLYWWLFEFRFRASEVSYDYLEQFLNILIPHQTFEFNVVLWFLPCLFLVNILFHFIYKIINIPLFYIFVLALILPYGWMLIGYNTMLIDEVLGALPFFVTGVVIRNAYNYGLSDGLGGGISLWLKCALLIILSLTLCFMGRNDMGSNNYAINYAFFFLCAILYILLMFSATNHISRVPKAVMWLSKNSLILMLIHEPVKRIIILLYSKIVNNDVTEVRLSIFNSFAILVITLIVLLPICNIINRNFGYFLGKK